MQVKNLNLKYWSQRIKGHRGMSKRLILENLEWFSHWMRNLKIGDDVVCLGFWSESFNLLGVERFERKLNKNGYQLAYVDIGPVGYGVIVNGEEENSIKIRYDSFQLLVADGTYKQSLLPFIVEIASKSIDRHLRIDIKIKNTLISFTIKRKTTPTIVETAATGLPKMVADLLPLNEQRYYVLSKSAEWKLSEFIGMWRFEENFWKT
jgi:hypothetical protein